MHDRQKHGTVQLNEYSSMGASAESDVGDVSHPDYLILVIDRACTRQLAATTFHMSQPLGASPYVGGPGGADGRGYARTRAREWMSTC